MPLSFSNLIFKALSKTTLFLGSFNLYLIPARCMFAQLLLQVFLFNPAKIVFLQTRQGISFLHEIPKQVILQKTRPLFRSISTGLLYMGFLQTAQVVFGFLLYCSVT